MSVVSCAYDRISTTYDAHVDVDRWARDQLLETYAAHFSDGDRLLEIGCGTGIDTEFLARRGCFVTGIDVSERMLEINRRRIGLAGLSDRVEWLLLDGAELGGLEGRTYDGIVSGFGALNTVVLDRFAPASARLLKPGGRMLLHLVGPCSVWERLYLLSSGKFSDALHLGEQESRTFEISGIPVMHTVLPPAEMFNRYFSSYFELDACFGMGVLRPPPHIRVPPALLSILTLLERSLRHVAFARNGGRFYLLDLKLRDSAHPMT